MKTNNPFVLSVIIITVLFTTLQSKAELVPVSDPFTLRNLAPINIGPTVNKNLIAVDSNAFTGNYVFCYSTEVSSLIICQVMTANDTLLYEKQIPKAPLWNSDFLEVKLSDESEIYVMYSLVFGLAINAFDSSGTAIFPIQRIETPDDTPWQNISMALTPSGFWVVGSRLNSNGSGFTDKRWLNIAYRFDRQGNELNNFFDKVNYLDIMGNCNATVSSNRSGDVIVSWIEKNDPTAIECYGSVVSRIFRESGTVQGDFIDVSSSRNAAQAYFRTPDSRADESGEFIVVWAKSQGGFNITSYLSRVYTVGNGSAIAAEEILSDYPNPAYPTLVSGSSGDDFAVFSSWRKDVSKLGGTFCSPDIQLALEGNLQPNVTFTSTGDCRGVVNGAPYEGYDFRNMLMLNDGSILEIFSERNVNIIKGHRYSQPSVINIDDVVITEGNPAGGQGPVAVVSITLSKPHPTDEIQVNYYTQDITALSGFDYAISIDTLTFPVGSTIQEVLIPIVADDIYENNETFSFNLELPVNAVIETKQSTVTIINDDSPPPIQNDCDNLNGFCQTIQEPLDGESNNIEIVLSMDLAQSLDVIFAYETEDVTATAGSDYIGSSGSITIPAGSTQTSLVIPVLGDLISESTETFKIKFSSTSTVNIVQPVLDIAILDKDDCLAVLSPIGHDADVDGGDFSFNIVVEDDCAWTVTPNDAWITVTSPMSGTDDATVTYTIPSQAGLQVLSREGSIDVTTEVPFTQVAAHTIVQDGDPSLCPFSVDTSQFDFDVNGGTGSFNVTGLDVCVWDVFSDVSWITITSPTAPVFGDSLVEFTVTTNAGLANVASDDRSSDLDAFFDVTINQTGCSYDLSEYTVSISDLTNDNITTNVLAPDTEASPCAWTAVSTASWLLVTDGNAGNGFGQVVMEALQNPSVEPRTGTVLIGDDMFTVVQAGQPCVYDIGDTVFSVCPDGNLKQVNISASAGCAWTLESDQSWLDIINNANGIGDENAGLQIMRNNSETDRTGILSFISGDPDPGTQIDSTYNQSGYLVYESFDGNSLPGDFVTTPLGSWQNANDELTGQLLNVGTGIAVEGTDQAYCSDCKVEGLIKLTSVSSFSEPNIGLVGWYRSESNYVALSMDELGNKWRLSLFNNGIESFVEVTDSKLVANQIYQLSISYDEDNIYAQVAGEQILQLQHNLNQAPSGYPGFMLNNANGAMDNLVVSGNSADADLIFDDGFEIELFQIPTQCSLGVIQTESEVTE